MSRQLARSDTDDHGVYLATTARAARELARMQRPRADECQSAPDRPSSPEEPLTARMALAMLIVLLTAVGYVLTNHPVLGVVLAGLSWVPLVLCCLERFLVGDHRSVRGPRNSRPVPSPFGPSAKHR